MAANAELELGRVALEAPRRSWVIGVKRLLRTWPATMLWKYAGAPVVGSLVGIVLIARVVAVKGPDHYEIVFVGKGGNDSVRQMYEGLSAGLGAGLAIRGVPVRLARKDDRGDEKQAAEIAAALAARGDVLMVVGHVASTPTRAALPAYMAAGIPVILTTETNPKLLPSQFGPDDFAPVWRLSPTDEAQAKTAADYAIDKLGATDFWVVQEAENDVYSKYLASEFIRNVHERGRAVVASSLSTSIPPPDLFKACRIKCVFFAGGWQNALILIRQVRAMSRAANVAPPAVMLGDSAAQARFLEQGGEDIAPGVYLTHPRKASDIGGRDGYACFGRDAAFLISELAGAADAGFSTILGERIPWAYRTRRLLNLHRVCDARLAVRSVMRATRDTGYQAGSSGERYVFRKSGERTGAEFHVWTVKRVNNSNAFADAP